MNLPRGGLLGRCAAVFRRLSDMEISFHAANAAFFLVLSVFPMLILLLSILRYTQLDALDLMALLGNYIPSTLHAVVERLLIQCYAYSGAAVVSVSAAGALWSSGRGIYGILRGLKRICGVTENRGWLYTRFLSAMYTLAFLLVVLLGLGLNVFGRELAASLPEQSPGRSILQFLMQRRFFLLWLSQSALFCAMFTVLPNRISKISRNLPGAILAGLGWTVLPDLFSRYAGYSNVYGGVYSLALGMLWLYCCLTVLFFGAALNRVFEEDL